MRILDRYIGSAVLVTSMFAIGVLSLVLVLGNVFKRLLDLLVNHDVPLDFILSFIAYVLPFSLSFTIPWGFLTAVLLVFGKLSAENELTAMRALGIGIPRIALPVIGLAVLFSLICLYINVEVAPRAHEKMRIAIYEMATSNPIALFGSDQVIEEFPGRKIYVGSKNGQDLNNIFVYEVDERNTPRRVIFAHRGRIEADSGGKTASSENMEIRMRLFDARFEQADEETPRLMSQLRHGITMQEGVLSISLKELHEKNQKRRGLSSMTLEELNARLDRGGNKAEVESATRTEVNKRFSFSLACFAFALIAVPFGITAQRRETSIGFAFSLAIAFVYFLFIIVADTFRDKPGMYPDLLVWTPNILFIGLGLFLFWRLSRR